MGATSGPDGQAAPLAGLRVVEFTHMVMGPTVGLVLAELGADVVKVEPLGGDKTRVLKGSGAGYFPMYNRAKRSLSIDLKSPEGLDIAHRLIKKSDILVENFRPGALDKLGLDYGSLVRENPALIYCSLKGFLSGPYEKRVALDEVTQMMGGLAYMTGPPGQPLRAGASVIDISGGMFGVIGIISSLYQRQQTGEGAFIKSALFETTAFMMGQHMAYAAQSEDPIPPMPARVSAWSIYRIFKTADGTPLFIGIISDHQWRRLCTALKRDDWLHDERLSTNQRRLDEASWFMPAFEAEIYRLEFTDACQICAEANVCYAPITRPEDLFDDPQLNVQDRALLDTQLPNGERTKLPRLPLEMSGMDFNLYHQPPMIGEATEHYLSELGYSEEECTLLKKEGVIVTDESNLKTFN